jgi:hypothetical protein
MTQRVVKGLPGMMKFLSFRLTAAGCRLIESWKPVAGDRQLVASSPKAGFYCR